CRGEGGFSKGTPDSDNLGEGRSALEASGASPVMGAPAGSLRKNALMMPVTPAPMRELPGQAKVPVVVAATALAVGAVPATADANGVEMIAMQPERMEGAAGEV